MHVHMNDARSHERQFTIGNYVELYVLKGRFDVLMECDTIYVDWDMFVVPSRMLVSVYQTAPQIHELQ